MDIPTTVLAAGGRKLLNHISTLRAFIMTSSLFITTLVCLLGTTLGRHPAAPSHSADNLPNTVFSCRDKVLGGYYADPDAQCQMFHVCVKVAGVGIQDFRFLCPNGTAFDQEAQICAGWADVACEPAALYYSSDNFDLYRIGSGFESKKAPAALEDESDYHLQRAEPDILSGAHSSNFFNNREGKDGQDYSENKVQNRNQVNDQPQRKKIVRKLQRKPTETAPKEASTPARQFTNNFAGSYAPTTARATAAPTSRGTPAPQYNNNYNQRGNDYQSFKPVSSTPAPYTPRVSPSSQSYQQSEQTTQQSRPTGRTFKSRTQSTADYNNYDNSQYYNKENKQQYNSNQQQQQQKSTADYNNYSSGSFNPQSTQASSSVQPSSPKYVNFNRERRPQISSTTSPSTTANYNANTNNRNTFNQQTFSQQTTPKSQDTFKNTKSTPFSQQPTVSVSTQQYNNQQPNFYSVQSTPQPFEKTKSAKYVEKKAQFNANNKAAPQQFNVNNNKPTPQQFNANNNFNKDTTQQFNNNYNNGQYREQQTPAPKFNTNLQYDNNNNQQSTPLYFNNQQVKTSPPVSTYQPQQQYTTKAPEYNNNFNQQRVSNDYQQFSTARPFAPSSTNFSPQAFDQRSTPVQQQYSTSRPSSANYSPQQFEVKSTAVPFKISSTTEDYDDGQYRPELYEREAGGEYDVTARQNQNQNQNQRNDFFPVVKSTPEPELLRAAHSLNIAASGNQLNRDIRPQQNASPAPVQKATTFVPRVPYTTTTPSSRSVYSSFAAVTSAAPRPFSAKPTTVFIQPPPKQVHPKANVPPSGKQTKPNGKDVSYDYAYYDNTDHYAEYENIEEFGRTSKKQ